MKSILISRIVQTEQESARQNLYTLKGRMYTYLNTVSYLTALNNKELFGQMDGIFVDGGLLVKAIKEKYSEKIH